MERLRRLPEGSEVHRPDAHDHAGHPGLVGLRAVDLRADAQPRRRPPFTYAQDGFEATRYVLQTDQFGTQLDPPAHWAPEYAAIDELPPTFAVRPLVVISIVPQVKKNFNYQMTSRTSTSGRSATAGSRRAAS